MIPPSNRICNYMLTYQFPLRQLTRKLTMFHGVYIYLTYSCWACLVFCVWLCCLVFQCLTLPDEFKRGKLLAYQLLCQTVVRRHDVPLPHELLSQFYMCLHAGIGSNDQVSHDHVRQMGFIAVFNANVLLLSKLLYRGKNAPFGPHHQWAILKLGFFYIFINKKIKVSGRIE